MDMDTFYAEQNYFLNIYYLSSFSYRSCSQRDRIGPYESCDSTWLTPFPVNPLAVGQYVNNQSKRKLPCVIISFYYVSIYLHKLFIQYLGSKL